MIKFNWNSINWQKIGQILTLLWPKYYNRITGTIVITGLTLLSKPLWLDFFNAVFKKYAINIIDENDPIYGIIVIAIALIYNTANKYIDVNPMIYNQNTVAQKEISKCRDVNSYLELCEVLIPLLDDNKYIFKAFGPNSSASETGPLRSDLTLWHNSRLEYIIPNNDIIECLITKNKHLIPQGVLPIFQKLNAHIFAFKKHVFDPKVDYSEFQFPAEIEGTIKDYCVKSNVEKEQFKKATAWISKNMRLREIEQLVIFGSYLFYVEKSNDLDIAVLLSISDKNEIIKINNKIKKIKKSFKNKHKKDLHLSIFTKSEAKEFYEFIGLNEYKLAL